MALRKQKNWDPPKIQTLLVDPDRDGGDTDSDSTHLSVVSGQHRSSRDETELTTLQPSGKSSSSQCLGTPGRRFRPRVSVTLGMFRFTGSAENLGCLHKAVVSGKEEDVENLLSLGHDINAHDQYGKTSLHCAVASQRLEMVKYLLRHKADVNSTDDRNDIPLHSAVRTGQIECVKVLLDDTHATPSNPNAQGNCGWTPLHIAAQCENPNTIAICTLLLESGASLLARDNKYMTPLAYATLIGSSDVMECFFGYANRAHLDINCLLVDVDMDGSTLLHLAVESGITKVVNLCLNQGSQVHTVKASDGSTAVHLSCTHGCIDILKLLFHSVSFIFEPRPDKEGMYPIHRAAQSNQAEILEYLLKQEHDINPGDNEYRTPLMVGAANGCFEAVRILLEHEADLTFRDITQRTVLHFAVGHPKIVKEVLKSVKAQFLIRCKDKDGNTPLHYVAQGGHIKDASMILIKYKSAASIENDAGEIPLHVASRCGSLTLVKKLAEGRKITMVNTTDLSERTPLHLASMNGHDQLVEYFLQKRAHVEVDVYGCTPLHYAALNGSIRSVELILLHYVECLNYTDKEQNTALHMAARGGHSNIVSYLLSKNSLLFIENARNQNVLDIAIEAKQEDVAMAIAQHVRWKEVLRFTNQGRKHFSTQIQLLVEHLPNVAKRCLDRCVECEGDPLGEDFKVIYDLRFIQGMPGEEEQGKNPRESLGSLDTMVKFHQLSCLTHPVSSVLMDIKWRKFGLVCFFVNFLLFALYMSFIMTMMLTITKDTSDNISHCDTNIINSSRGADGDVTSTTDISCDNAIQLMFKKGPIFALISVYIIIVSAFNLLKEIFQVFDEGLGYFFSINNWLEVSLYVTALVALMIDVTKEKSEMAACVFLLWFVALLYLSKFNYLGLYIVMIRKILSTALKVLPLLMVFLAAFAFGFYVILVDNMTSFSTPISAMATTFVMMLDTLNFDKLLNKQDDQTPGKNTDSPVFYMLYFSFCFMMPIIFLNLLIGLAVGDIDKIRRTAALERYTSQVEHLSQLERALPAFILKRVQVSYYIDYPNRRKAWKDKIVDFLVSLLSPRDEGVGNEPLDDTPEPSKRILFLNEQQRLQHQQQKQKQQQQQQPKYEDMKDLIATLKEDILLEIREQFNESRKYGPEKKESRGLQAMETQPAEFIFV